MRVQKRVYKIKVVQINKTTVLRKIERNKIVGVILLKMTNTKTLTLLSLTLSSTSVGTDIVFMIFILNVNNLSVNKPYPN